MTIEEQVRVQYAAFETELSTLLTRIPGRYVAYYDGVRWDGDDSAAALAWAYEHLGIDIGFVIAKVELPRVYQVRWPT